MVERAVKESNPPTLLSAGEQARHDVGSFPRVTNSCFRCWSYFRHTRGQTSKHGFGIGTCRSVCQIDPESGARAPAELPFPRRPPGASCPSGRRAQKNPVEWGSMLFDKKSSCQVALEIEICPLETGFGRSCLEVPHDHGRIGFVGMGETSIVTDTYLAHVFPNS